MLLQRPSSPRQRHARRGFSFIEVMVVIIILGLLAGIVGINLFSGVDDAKIKTTKVNIEQLGAALDLYRLHNNRYPTTEQGLNALTKKPEVGTIPKNWNGPYLKKVPKDGWDNDFKYTSGDGTDYEIKSFGSDGEEGGSEKNADLSSKEIQ